MYLVLHAYVRYAISTVHCNVQGLLGSISKPNSTSGTHTKLDHLRCLLGFKDAPSVFALSETKLSSRIEDNELNINEYTLFRRNRNRQSGRVAIYCRS